MPLHPSIQHVHFDGDPTPEKIELINKLAQAAYNTPMKKTTEPTTTLPSDDEISENAKKYRVEDINDSITRVGGFIIGAKWMRSLASPIIAQLQKENEELKKEKNDAVQFIRDVSDFADGMKILDGEALQVLKNTARRVLSDKPTQLPRK